MDTLTQAIITRRERLTAARQHAEMTHAALALAEADLFLNCGYTTLGKNEAERKAIFDNLKRNDAAYRLALQGAQIAERAKATAADDLAAAEDARRAYENELRRVFLQCQFGVNVDPAKFSLDNQF